MTGFSRTTTRVARKPHTCRFCMTSIAVGESYLDEAYRAGPDFFACRSHPECSHVEDDMLMRFDIGCDEDRPTILTIHPDDIAETIGRVPAFARRTRVVLAGVDTDCVTRLDPVPGGVLAAAEHGSVKVDIIVVSSRSSEAPLLDAQAAVLDSLMVAVVKSRLLEASPLDIRAALEAGERGGELDMGLIRAVAYDLGVEVIQ